jgi:hypothetical protein
MDRRNFLRSLLMGLPAVPLLGSQIRAEPAPRLRAVLLQTMPLAGFQYYEGETVWSQLALGDRLELRREATNPYDENAIEVYWQGRKLGYLPRSQNETAAGLMDQRVSLFGRVSRRQDDVGPWQRLELELWLES